MPVEEQHTEQAIVNPQAESYEAIRREQALVSEYMATLESKGSSLVRLRILPPGEAKPLYCDLYVPGRNTLIEAKGTGTRNEIRMAVGQLADYARFVDPAPRLAVLLPQRPRPDLEALLNGQGIVIWKEGPTFVDNASGQFV